MPEVKERPILFAGPMIRALLAGRKTQTRRVVTGFEITGPNPPFDSRGGLYDFYRKRGPGNGWCGAIAASDGKGAVLNECPYGVPGDRLWVRETWAVCSVDGSRAYIARAERMPAGKTLADTDGGLDEVGNLTPEQSRWAEDHIDHERWKPSIFMPRWASRITLEVTAVRVERLHDIREGDALAEGFEPKPVTAEYVGETTPGTIERRLAEALMGGTLTAKFAFEFGWDSINGKRAPWASNPWVWVVGFKRV